MTNLCGKCGFGSFADFIVSTSTEEDQRRPRSPGSVEDDHFWIQCDVCERWFHGRCVDVEEYECVFISEYHCIECQASKGPSKVKQQLNRHRYQFFDSDAETKLPQIGTEFWIKAFRKEEEKFPPCVEKVKILEFGCQLTEQALKKNSWDTPVLVQKPEGLNLKLPNITVEKLVEVLGSERKVDVIDVYRQHSFRMSLGRFLKHWNEKPRTKLYNIVSLEVSKTRLSDEVRIPTIVEDISWVHNIWPCNSSVEGVGDEYQRLKPEIAKFCLIGMKDSFTDFHVDFGGSSVWYHVLKGKKIFYIMEPSERNLASFERHSADPNRSEKFFGSELPNGECRRLEVNVGETLFIPGGWIHAVWTPVDSLVFGGNFLHSLHIPMQLRINDMEERLNTDERYMFPNFHCVCFFAAKYLMEAFHDANDAKTIVEGYLLEGAQLLLYALKNWMKRDKGSKTKAATLSLEYGRTIRGLQKEINAQQKLKSQNKSRTWPKKFKSSREGSVEKNRALKNNAKPKTKMRTGDVIIEAVNKDEKLPFSVHGTHSKTPTLKLKLNLADSFPEKAGDSTSSGGRSLVKVKKVQSEAGDSKDGSMFRFCPLKLRTSDDIVLESEDKEKSEETKDIAGNESNAQQLGFSLVNLQRDRSSQEDSEKKGLSLLIKRSQIKAPISPIKIAREIDTVSADKIVSTDSPNSSGLDISGIFGTSSHGRVQKPSRWVTGAVVEAHPACATPQKSMEFVPELGQHCHQDEDFIYPSLIDSDTEEQGQGQIRPRKRKTTDNVSQDERKVIFSIVEPKSSSEGEKEIDYERDNLIIFEKPQKKRKKKSKPSVSKGPGKPKKMKGGATAKQRLASKLRLHRFNMQIL